MSPSLAPAFLPGWLCQSPTRTMSEPRSANCFSSAWYSAEGKYDFGVHRAPLPGVLASRISTSSSQLRLARSWYLPHESQVIPAHRMALNSAAHTWGDLEVSAS